MHKLSENKSLPWFDLSVYAPGGPVAKQITANQARAAELGATRDKVVGDEMTKAVLGLGLLGVGAGLTGTKLYNLVNQLNKPKEKYTTFGPGPKRVDNEEKIANDGWWQNFLNTIASAPGNAVKGLEKTWDRFNNFTPNQQAVLMPAALLSSGLGLYGGHAIAKAIEDKKRKEDIQIDLEDARKEYQRALTGKRAEALDAAFTTYKKVSNEHEKTATDAAKNIAWGADWLAESLRRVGVWPLYVTSVLGSGLMAGKMTYDWTRERSKDKALERARRSRARMEESSPLYIDPAQLEAIKTLNQKEIDKVRQKEIV